MIILNYFRQHLRTVRVLSVACTLLTACQKEGELQLAPQVTEATIRVFSLNPDSRFAIFIDDRKLGDSVTSNQTVTRVVEKLEGAQHFVVRDIISGTTMLDTMVLLGEPVAGLSVIEYSTDPGSEPVFLTGDTQIAPDSAKIGLYLEGPGITAPVDIYLYRGDLMNNRADTVPLHVFRSVNNYSTTGFATIAVDPGTFLLVELRDPDTGELLPGILNNTQVSANDPWSSIAGTLCIMPGTETPSNVHNLLRVGVAWEGSPYWAVVCMISF